MLNNVPLIEPGSPEDFSIKAFEAYSRSNFKESQRYAGMTYIY